MNILWAIVIIPYLGANPVFVEVWSTREPCEKYAREIKHARCFPVTVSDKHEVEEQVKAINGLLK
jgi:hypothetical protein